MQAAVFGVVNAVMGELVHAAVVLRPKQRLAPAPAGAELVAWCRTLLAGYKVVSCSPPCSLLWCRICLSMLWEFTVEGSNVPLYRGHFSEQVLRWFYVET